PVLPGLRMTRRTTSLLTAVAALLLPALLAPTAAAQSTVLPEQVYPVDSTDPVALLVSQLNLESYKATIKALTQFGDRRAGTARNRAAIDWIEAQLKSYGC